MIAVPLLALAGISQGEGEATWKASGLELTTAEAAWLGSHPVIRFSAAPDWPPFSIRQDGTMTGVDVDILALLATRLGIQIEYVPSGSWQETIELINRRSVDVVAGTARIPERNLPVVYTEPYASFPVALIMRADGPFFTDLVQLKQDRVKMAGPEGHAPTLFVRANFPDTPMETTKTSLDAMRLVASGEADAMIENLGVAAHLIKTQGFANLKITGLTRERFDPTFAVRDDAEELRGILDKALRTVTEEDRLHIYDKWVLVDYSSMRDWGPTVRIGIVALVFAASIIGVISVWNRRLRAELARRKLAEASLEKSESRFRHLFETTPDAYFLTRPTGEIQLVNAEAVRMLEIGSRRFVERLNIATFFEKPGERERLMHTLRSAGSLRDHHLEFSRADGSTCSCRCNLQILRDTTGEEVAVEYVARWQDDEPPRTPMPTSRPSDR